MTSSKPVPLSEVPFETCFTVPDKDGNIFNGDSLVKMSTLEPIICDDEEFFFCFSNSFQHIFVFRSSDLVIPLD